MPFRRTALLLAAALCAPVPAAASAAPRTNRDAQSIFMRAVAGDGSSDGIASLTAVKENNGFRLRGYLEPTHGCVELKAVNKHLGMYYGGDSILKACEANTRARVDAWTHHTDVVLTAVVPHGIDSDSPIVELTGR